MTRFSNEALVGLLTLVVLGLTAWGVLRTDDRPDGMGGTWLLYVQVPTAEGIYPDTPVRIAGVTVGGVDAVDLDGRAARLTLMLQPGLELPVDTVVDVGSEGMLGDKFIRLTPGKSETLVRAGSVVQAQPPGASIDSLTAKLSLIADDVGVITGEMRKVAEDGGTQAQLQTTMANIEELSAQLRDMAAVNQADLRAMAENMRATSEALKVLVEGSGGKVDAQLDAIREATESLDRAVRNIESITGKLDRGEGTVGKLLNDPTTIDSINDTLAEVNTTVKEVSDLVGGVSDLRTDVYYRGNYYLGTDPVRGEFAGNPVAGGTRNVLGLILAPRPDYWYILELTSHPVGLVSYEDHLLPEFGSSWREYSVSPTYRVSFQFAKRWGPAVFRFGMKESSGGAGVDAYLLRDRLMLSADVYDFLYGSWPVMDGTPNVQFALRAYPWKHVYLEGGADNVLLGAKYGYFTGFVGGGFTFNDQDLKLLLPAMPSP